MCQSKRERARSCSNSEEENKKKKKKVVCGDPEQQTIEDDLQAALVKCGE